jgi:hypothetical protein
MFTISSKSFNEEAGHCRTNWNHMDGDYQTSFAGGKPLKSRFVGLPEKFLIVPDGRSKPRG